MGKRKKVTGGADERDYIRESREKIEKYRAVIELVNKAKNINEYGVANAATAWLAHECLKPMQQFLDDGATVERKDLPFKVLYEVSDGGEVDLSRSWYDNIHFIIENTDCCMPVPRFNRSIVGLLLEYSETIDGQAIDGIEHNRDRSESNPEEVKALWDELYKLTDGEFWKAMLNVLQDEEEIRSQDEDYGWEVSLFDQVREVFDVTENGEIEPKASASQPIID